MMLLLISKDKGVCLKVLIESESPLPGNLPDPHSPLPPDMTCFLSPCAVPEVTPANVSGGGGSKSELVITWEVNESQSKRNVHASKLFFLFSSMLDIAGKFPPLFLTVKIHLSADTPSHVANG